MAKPPKNGVQKVRFLTEVDFSALAVSQNGGWLV